MRTRVGYAGGSKNDPTYYDLGDHMEAIQIDYDPDILTYRDLLQVFLSSHDPSWPSPVRQYASAVFAHDEEQERLARAALGEIAGSSGKPPATLVLAYTGFNRAEDYHQKYYLRSATAIASLYQGLYPDTESFTDSTAVARVNGYIGGNGTVEQLETELPLLGLGDDLGRALLDYVAMWGK